MDPVILVIALLTVGLGGGVGIFLESNQHAERKAFLVIGLISLFLIGLLLGTWLGIASTYHAVIRTPTLKPKPPQNGSPWFNEYPKRIEKVSIAQRKVLEAEQSNECS